MPFPTSLLSVLHGHAQREPPSDFLTEDKSASLTYAESYLFATRLIPARLKSLWPSIFDVNDIQDLPRVLILTPNNSLFALTYFSLWHSNAVVVPISTSTDPSLWLGMVNLVKPQLILASRVFVKSLQQALGNGDQELPIVAELATLIPQEYYSQPDNTTRASDFIPSLRVWMTSSFNKETLQRVENFLTPNILNPDSPAVTLFTSSAVDLNTLKCVTYTHTMLVQSSHRCIQMLGGEEYASSPKRHLGWLPLSHCFEFCITFCSIVLLTGGNYIFFDRTLSSPSAASSTPLPALLLSGLAYHHPVTSLTSVPALIPELFTPPSPSIDNPSDGKVNPNTALHLLRLLHSLGVGGAPTPQHLFSWAAARDIKYFDCSGATEVAGTICVRRSWEETQKLNGLQIIPGLMGLLEKSNPGDDFGELIIRAKHIPTGYDHRTSSAYQFDPTTGVTTYHTGDLYSHKTDVSVLSFVVGEKIPEYDPDREPLAGLTYIGRVDDMIILSSGVKVDALSLERALDSQPGVERSALLSNKNGDTVLALIQPKHPFDNESIIEAALALNTSLPFEKRLRRENIYLVAGLPVTAKLTLNRKKIRKALSEIKTHSEIPFIFSPAVITSDVVTRPSLEPMFHTILPNPAISRRVITLLCDVFSIPESQIIASSSKSFSSIPLTSLASTRLAKALKEEFNVEITSAQIYGLSTVNDLVKIIQTERERSQHDYPKLDQKLSSGSSFSSLAAPENTVRAQTQLRPNDFDIIITGAACRFPGGIDSLSELWSALLAPSVHLSSLSRIRPASRWPSPHPKENFMHPSGWLDDTVAVLNNTKSFAEFFELREQEVESMSPNVRIAMQIGYQAILDAGVKPSSLNGAKWGVFTSLNDSGWKEKRLEEVVLKEYSASLASCADESAGARLSYFLNLTGPAVEIKTACSSSAVAIHQACLAIRNGDCDAGIVIASTTHFHPSGALFRSQNGIVSPTGKCLAFSDMADGFVASEGAAAIILQRSNCSHAQNMAYGVIKATSVTQDGTSRGFYAPNPKAQKRLLEDALDRAGLQPDDIDFLEAHGTGTQLGDEIELQTVNEIFKRRKQPLCIGSIKAVIGHTEECAGLAGVLKAILSLQNNAIPPQPPLGPLNKAIDYEGCKITVPTKILPLLKYDSRSSFCAVSSFGLYGTLASVILEGPPQDAPTVAQPTDAVWHRANSPSLFVLSARSPADLLQMIKTYYDFFTMSYLRIKDLETVCRTSQIGRDHFIARRAWAVTGWRELLDSLYRVLSIESISNPLANASFPKFGLWFSLPFGNLPNGFHSEHPLYMEKLLQCQNLGWSPEYDFFINQLALAKSLAELGCEVTVVGGEGITEYLAAVFAGFIPASSVFKMKEEKTSSSRVYAVRSSLSTLNNQLANWRSDELRIMGRHGPGLFTVDGTQEAIEDLATQPGIIVNINQPLPPQTILAPIELRKPPFIPIASSHLGELLDEETVTSFEYWNFVQNRDMQAENAWTAMAEKCDVVINLGMTEEMEKILKKRCIAGCGYSFESFIGALFDAGCNINWEKFASQGPRAHLPPYFRGVDSI